MSQIKVLSAANFNKHYLLLDDSNGTLSLIDEKGDFCQFNKIKFEIDSIQEIPANHLYQFEEFSHLKTSALKWRGQEEKEKLEDFLKLKLIPHHEKQDCFIDNEKGTHVSFYFAQYNPQDELCRMTFNEQNFKSGENHLREVVVLIMEEFGVLYLDGLKLKDYFQKLPSKKKRKGKKAWDFHVGYKSLLGVPGQKAFSYYSDDLNFIRNFTFDDQKNNIIDLSVIRRVSDIQSNLTRREMGITVRKSA